MAGNKVFLAKYAPSSVKEALWERLAEETQYEESEGEAMLDKEWN